MRTKGTGLLNETLSAMEITMALSALERAKFNKAQAARELGIERTTLVELLRRHDRYDLIHAPVNAAKPRRRSDSY